MPPSTPDPIKLSIFNHLFASVAEEMGVTLGRTGYSPNIKERRDYSCAVFLGDGRMLAQAAHIPVHLGAMPESVRAAIEACEPFHPGDVIILNDPYLGGTHLPDITLVSPVFFDDDLAFFVASRAHHADIGGMSPGSMPVATEVYQEGIIIPPVRLVRAGELQEDLLALILRNSRTPEERQGDLAAQRAAHRIGERRLGELIEQYGLAEVQAQAEGLLTYAEQLIRAEIRTIPDGAYVFRDMLDDSGITNDPLPVQVTVTVAGDQITVDFAGTADAAAGPMNAVRAIASSAVMYVLRTLASDDLPMNAGVFAPVDIVVPAGSLLDPGPPHAVAGGNVETSQRVVDVLFGALAQALPDRVPAASQGTMNNFSLGGIHPGTGQVFAYYETIAGGAGAGPHQDGASAVQVHMTNTANTPIEALEMALPIRVERFGIRTGSGGAGHYRGGDGLVRTVTFLAPARVTILSERRRRGPYGLAGGSSGTPGRNLHIGLDGDETQLPG
ncbi:MAG: hydantoinase B/oxoprolinase family protein [Anaerolineae bacterium]